MRLGELSRPSTSAAAERRSDRYLAKRRFSSVRSSSRISIKLVHGRKFICQRRLRGTCKRSPPHHWRSAFADAACLFRTHSTPDADSEAYAVGRDEGKSPCDNRIDPVRLCAQQFAGREECVPADAASHSMLHTITWPAKTLARRRRDHIKHRRRYPYRGQKSRECPHRYNYHRWRQTDRTRRQAEPTLSEQMSRNRRKGSGMTHAGSRRCGHVRLP